MGVRKLMPQSPSSVGVFNTCPYQYRAKYITKEDKFVPTPATERGNRIHKALELRVAQSAPLPDEISKMEVFVSKILSFNGAKLTECKLAVDKDGKAVEWRHRYIGGAIDLTVVDKDKGSALVFDYKTGQIKDTADFQFQLLVYATLIFAKYPFVDFVRVAFVGVDNLILKPVGLDGKKGVLYERKDLPDLLGQIRYSVSRIETATIKDEFIPTPNGLCRRSEKNGGKPWCNVQSCPFWGKN